MRWAGLPGAPLKVSNFLLYLLFLFFNNFLFYSHFLACAGYIALKQQCVPHTNTNSLAMIPTYGGVLSAIKKALRELVEEYRGVRKSLWDLVEGQKRNMAQLERIGAAMEQRWGSEEHGKENGDEEEGSKDVPGESQEGAMSRSSTVDFILFSLFIFVLLFFYFSFLFFYF